MTIRVLLADDSDVMRRAISRLLGDDQAVELIAETTSYVQTEQLIRELRPHVVVMDIHMGDGHPTISSQLKATLAGARLIAISLSLDQETKDLADGFGAEVLLDKMNLVAELLPAIKRCVGSPKHN